MVHKIQICQAQWIFIKYSPIEFEEVHRPQEISHYFYFYGFQRVTPNDFFCLLFDYLLDI